MFKIGLKLIKAGACICWLSAILGWAAIFYMLW